MYISQISSVIVRYYFVSYKAKDYFSARVVEGEIKMFKYVMQVWLNVCYGMPFTYIYTFEIA